MKVKSNEKDRKKKIIKIRWEEDGSIKEDEKDLIKYM